MSLQARVRKHFDKDAVRFDAIYEPHKPLAQRIVDRMFRAVVLERFRLVCNLAPQPGAWTVLDVGCGSGRYGIALAREGAARAVGIDFSSAMIELARREAAEAGFADRCRFEVGEFLDFAERDAYDAVLAMGYFDYLTEPLPHLKKMSGLCRGRLFASFPKRWEWRVPVRKVRFLVQGGFVRFYSRGEVDALVRAAGLPEERVSILNMDRDWILIARP